MHMLMLTGSLPYPPHQGGAIRAFGILHGLYHAGHKITLLSFHDPEQGVRVENTPLMTYCERVITVPAPTRSTAQRLKDLLFSAQADIARRLQSDAMTTKLKQLLASTPFDLIQFEGIEIANYLFTAQSLQPQTPIIYDAFNAEATLQKVIAQVDRNDAKRLPNALYSYIQAQRIERFERALCQAASAVIAVSDEDAAELTPFRNDDCIHVVPSGIFTADYTDSGEQLDLKPNALVFTGKMDYRPNVDAMTWFTQSVLPSITRQTDANLYIVGQKPHKRLEALRMNRNVHITGWVAEVQPYLQAADVYVAPLRMGSGTRLKILEALAAGCAVVATPTAAAGLAESAKQHMCITDTAEDMASSIVSLLQNPQQRATLGASAREYIRQTYDWSVLIPRLLAVYGEMSLV